MLSDVIEALPPPSRLPKIRLSMPYFAGSTVLKRRTPPNIGFTLEASFCDSSVSLYYFEIMLRFIMCSTYESRLSDSAMVPSS